MSNELSPLEALERLRHCYIDPDYDLDFDTDEVLETIEKALKALEIIKKKQVDCQLFINLFICQAYTYEDYFRYIIHTEYNKLTKEEYDFLTEVLK